MIPHYSAFTILLFFCILVVAVQGMEPGGFENATVSGTIQEIAETPSISEHFTNDTICTSTEHREFRVIQGEPFIYQGTVPENTSHSVDVFVYSDRQPIFYPRHVPVNADGVFSFTISGNETRHNWEEYIMSSKSTSPYDHICIKYSMETECFDLLIVEDAKNLTLIKMNNWIRIDPLPDRVISLNERQDYTGNFYINGTTDLPPGEEIRLTMESTCMMPCPKTVSDDIGCCGGWYKTFVNVQEGFCGTNIWSVFINTTPNRIKMMRGNDGFDDINDFLVSVTRQNRNHGDNGWDAAHFVIRIQEEVAPKSEPMQSFPRPSPVSVITVLGAFLIVSAIGLLVRKKD